MLFYGVYYAIYENKRSSPTNRRLSAPKTQLKFHADNLHDSAIVNTLVIIVLGDNALKSVSIILLRQAKYLVLQLFLSLEERRHVETKRKV